MRRSRRDLFCLLRGLSLLDHYQTCMHWHCLPQFSPFPSSTCWLAINDTSGVNCISQSCLTSSAGTDEQDRSTTTPQSLSVTIRITGLAMATAAKQTNSPKSVTRAEVGVLVACCSCSCRSRWFAFNIFWPRSADDRRFFVPKASK